MAYHEPVLVEEVLRWLRPQAGGLFLDATVGGGGHALAILQCSARVRLIGLDCDEAAIQAARDRLQSFESRTRLIRANFSELPSLKLERVDGVLFDLGLSSHQVDTAGRGFSFAKEGPLDMRMDQRLVRTAATIVAEASERELTGMIRGYGDEKKAKRIAAEIVRTRKRAPIRTTTELARIIERAVGSGRPGRIAPATRTFMALRMAVNGELDNLSSGLAAATDLLASAGRLAVLTFHSGEDRVVKDHFRRESSDCICPPEIIRCQCGHVRSLRILTRKPVVASDEEIRRNPRARSAKLRVAERI